MAVITVQLLPAPSSAHHFLSISTQYPQESQRVFPSRWRRWAKPIRLNFTVLACLGALAQFYLLAQALETWESSEVDCGVAQSGRIKESDGRLKLKTVWNECVRPRCIRISLHQDFIAMHLLRFFMDPRLIMQ